MVGNSRGDLGDCHSSLYRTAVLGSSATHVLASILHLFRASLVERVWRWMECVVADMPAAHEENWTLFNVIGSDFTVSPPH